MAEHCALPSHRRGGGGGGAGGAGILQSTHKNTVNLSFVTFYQAAKML